MQYLADLGVISNIPRKQGRAVQPVVRAPRWSPPTGGMVKLNVDGGIAKNSRKGAVMMICLDDQGVYLGSSACIVKECMDTGTLEAMACS